MIHPTPEANSWAVIELSGHVGERMGHMNFKSWAEAMDWLEEEYDEDERETLHIDIARWDAEGFWSYDY